VANGTNSALLTHSCFNPVDGARLDALIADLNRIPQDVIDGGPQHSGFWRAIVQAPRPG